MKANTAQDLWSNKEYQNFVEAFSVVVKKAGEVSLDEGRRLSTRFFLPPDTVFEPVARIENITVTSKDGHKIPVRIFVPDASGKLPVLIYFHRGGWVFGNIEEADPICRKLANRSGFAVASVEYRLAPENPFPKPLEDAYAVTEWMGKNAQSFGGDSQKLIVCGESAGGTLAAAVALMARDKKGPHLAAQLLIYPIISSTILDASYDDCAERYFITKDAMKFFWSMYIQSPEYAVNPYASPDKAKDHSQLPPAFIITAEHDPLAKEAASYAVQLRNAGVKVQTKTFPGVIHGFLDLPIYKEKQKAAWIQDIIQTLGHFEKSHN